MKYLVTGSAGFIGSHVAHTLLEAGHAVVGIDNLSDYYDVSLKQARLDRLQPFDRFTNLLINIADHDAMMSAFKVHKPDYVINLAAQAGVRHSITHPYAYLVSNLSGFLNILECCRHYPVKHLIYASTSSAYGANEARPFTETACVDHPVSLYAATKRSNELMAHSYAHLYNIPCSGLRFFTVYGPWGRPDMAYFKFTKNIIEGRPIDIYNNGDMYRDFTFIDDIVEGITRLCNVIPTPNPAWDAHAPTPDSSGVAPVQIYNIGNSEVVPLMDFIDTLENIIGKKAARNMMDFQPGDVHSTRADTSKLERVTGFKPQTALQAGLEAFVTWYRNYYSV